MPDIELKDLMSALQDVLKRSEAFEHHHIHKESLSTRARMSDILARLKDSSHNFIEFSQLFLLEEGRHGIVVTFLAILELVKESLITCLQAQPYGAIQVKIRERNDDNGTELAEVS